MAGRERGRGTQGQGGGRQIAWGFVGCGEDFAFALSDMEPQEGCELVIGVT